MKKSQQSAIQRLTVTTLVTIASAVTAVTAQAAYIVNATETGGDVVFEGSGRLDLTAWARIGWGAGGTTFVDADLGFLVGASSEVDLYNSATNYSGPTNIGPGTTRTSAQSQTGDLTGITFADQLLYTPRYYNSDTNLTGTTTYTTATFDSLGLTPGSYEWTWGSAASADSYTLNVGAVPVPAAVWLFGSGLLGLIGVARRKVRV
jgi:hypothetical protein